MGTKIAVNSMSLEPTDPLVICTIVLSGSPSLKSGAEGNPICTDGIQVTVTGITVPSASATIPDPGRYVVPLSASATKVKVDGDLVILEGDESDTINATPQIPGPTPYPISFKIKVSVAGQAKVKGI